MIARCVSSLLPLLLLVAGHALAGEEEDLGRLRDEIARTRSEMEDLRGK